MLTILLAFQAILTASAVLMSLWAKMPWFGTLGLGLLGGSAMCAGLFCASTSALAWKGLTGTAWVCTGVSAGSLVLTAEGGFGFERCLDQYYAVLAWLIAAAALPVTRGALTGRHRPTWKPLVAAWAFSGAVIWLAAAYSQNQRGAFYAGLVINVTLLVMVKLRFHLPGWTIQMINTVILIGVGLPLADLVFHPAYRLRTRPELRAQLYSFAAGQKDPAGYAAWWDVYLQEVDSLEKEILMPDPERRLPYRLRPRSHGMLFQSRVSINSLGFRGPELPQQRGKTYRIIALGESTTFGITLNPQDRPWPELLQDIIRERLKPSRRVEVINAGVPGYTLEDNLSRFAQDILPLKPDLVLSYHGINGFSLLNPVLPSNIGPPPPRYRERPVHLLADCEYRLKLLKYRHRHGGGLKFPAGPAADPLTSVYADAYRELIALSETNHFRLALGNFSMAVNAGSNPDVIRFYQAAYPTAPLLIEANAAHTRLLEGLAERCPRVCFVNTHPNLDGVYGNFLDLVHFAPAGDRQLAESFFEGIRKILEEDLVRD